MTSQEILRAMAAAPDNQTLESLTRQYAALEGIPVRDSQNMLAASTPNRDAQGRFVAQQQTQAVTPAATPAPEPRVFAKILQINGREFEIQADSPEELERLELQSLQIANELATAAQNDTQEQLSTVDRAELEIQFKRGEISAKDYLERTGAVAEYLREQGVPLDELQEALAESRDEKAIQSWADATNEFLTSEVGASWPGGERNKNQLGLMLQTLGLLDAEDKVAALAQAYAEMQRTGMLFDADLDEQRVVQEALANATPQQILEMYKQGLGVADNPEAASDAFVRNFSRSGSGISSSGIFNR